MDGIGDAVGVSRENLEGISDPQVTHFEQNESQIQFPICLFIFKG